MSAGRCTFLSCKTIAVREEPSIYGGPTPGGHAEPPPCRIIFPVSDKETRREVK